MALAKVKFAAAAGGYTCSLAEDQSGEYVKAEAAETLEALLRKLTWLILYGKHFEATEVAVRAEKLLSETATA